MLQIVAQGGSAVGVELMPVWQCMRSVHDFLNDVRHGHDVMTEGACTCETEKNPRLFVCLSTLSQWWERSFYGLEEYCERSWGPEIFKWNCGVHLVRKSAGIYAIFPTNYHRFTTTISSTVSQCAKQFQHPSTHFFE